MLPYLKISFYTAAFFIVYILDRNFFRHHFLLKKQNDGYYEKQGS
jgi:hypothetical protein